MGLRLAFERCVLAVVAVLLLSERALGQGETASQGPTVKAAVLRASEGAKPELADAVDAALLRDLSAVAGIDSPAVSPIDYAEIQLTVGCSDEGRACLSAVAKLAQVDAIVVRKLTVGPESATLSLTYFDATSADEPVRAEQSLPAVGLESAAPQQVPALVRKLFGIPEPVAAAASEAPAQGPASAPAGSTAAAAEPDQGGGAGPLTWVVLGVGAVTLGAGLVVGLSAQGDFDDYKKTPIDDPADAERADAKFEDAESGGMLATILVPAGGALIALGVTLLAIDLSAGGSEETGVALVPQPGGALLRVRGSLGGP
jgi:hypothetical protein